MTYQPLNHKKHFTQTIEVFEILLEYSDNNFSEEQLLLAADELIHIGNGKISSQKVKEYAQRPNFFSHNTYSIISDRPWSCVPSCYDYDEETFPAINPVIKEKLTQLSCG